MNAIGGWLLLVLTVTVLFAPKRIALLAMIAGIIYLTQGQAIVISGFHLYPSRIIELAGFARVCIRGELLKEQLNKIDVALVTLYLLSTIVFLMRSREGQAYQIGLGVDALLTYFAFRGLVSTFGELDECLRALALLLIPLSVLVVSETLTRNNPFAILGGPELAYAGDLWVRGSRLRATGSFQHPSLLGTVGGSFISVFVGLAVIRGRRVIASLGIVVCLVIVWASNSGGPASCVVIAVVGWLLWPMRWQMKFVRRVTVAGLVITALFMKAPIWYLLARFSNIVGGDGWHRSALLDVAFQNLGKWWLWGMPLSDTSTWLPYTNTFTGAADMTNNFLVFGIASGLGAVALLIFLLSTAFRHVGIALRTAQSGPQHNIERQAIYWGLGVTLTVHTFNWFSITYFDQSYMIWLLHLAMVSGVTGQAIRGGESDTGLPTVGKPKNTLDSRRSYLARARRPLPKPN